MRRLCITALLAACLALGPGARAADLIRIGSKNFTESVILGELLREDAMRHQLSIEHRRGMGGSAILWQALIDGDIDAYPEYTGTLTQELLHDLPQPVTAQALRAALQARGLGISASLGFEDRYALGVSDASAARWNLKSVSDLAAHPQLRFALSNEFMNRSDGWIGLRRSYALAPQSVRGVEHSLAYRALASGAADVIDLYTTDPEIQGYRVRVLSDDRHFFPDYQAVWLYRLQSVQRSAALLASIQDLQGRIAPAAMQSMNAAVQLEHRTESSVADAFLSAQFGGTLAVPAATQLRQRLWLRTREHLALVGSSMLLALLFGLPLGVLASMLPRLGRVVLAVTVVLQTVPTLAMLVFMIPLLGIGARPAIATLFLYSLLPIVRNTLTGLSTLPTALRESAASLGLPWHVRLRKVELPLAARSIVAGISLAAVISVGTATLGALIGAGGYGESILTGIRLNDLSQILEGAIPAALMALGVMLLFQGLERLLTPRGLRLAFHG